MVHGQSWAGLEKTPSGHKRHQGSSHSRLWTPLGTGSLVPRLRAIPSLKVEFHRGTFPSCLGTCLPRTVINMPPTEPRMSAPRGIHKPVPSHSQPRSLPPVTISISFRSSFQRGPRHQVTGMSAPPQVHTCPAGWQECLGSAIGTCPQVCSAAE